jgi:nicotinamidase-related amidase
MFCCATLFFWAGVLPRETISGLFGRKGYTATFWRMGRQFIDWLHTGHEFDHCVETAVCEARMREELYKCMPG